MIFAPKPGRAMHWLQRFDAWYYAALPAERLALLRIALGSYSVLYLLFRASHLNRVVDYPAAAFAPVGPVSLLEQPLGAPVVYALYAAALLSGVAFSAGVRYALSGPAFALLLLWVTSYRHSWGMIFHTDNLLVLQVLVLAAAPAADAYARRSLLPAAQEHGPNQPASLATSSRRYGWAVRSLGLITVASYVAAGVAKLTNTGWSWALGDALREQIAYDTLRKLSLGSAYSPFAPWLLPQGWLFPMLSVFTLAVELLAPLALLGRRAALVWALAAWLFHMGVVASMAIVFPFPVSGCAFLCLFPLERAASVGWVRRLARRFSAEIRAPGV